MRNPTCRHILTLELHQIVWVKDGGANDPENLLALCPNCHSLHTQGHIPAYAIRTWKSLLLALNSANHVTADLLLMLQPTRNALHLVIQKIQRPSRRASASLAMSC